MHAFFNVTSLYEYVARALARQHICAGPSEPLFHTLCNKSRESHELTPLIICRGRNMVILDEDSALKYL